MNELSKERSARLVKTRAYMPARYAHVMPARDHVQLRLATTKTTHTQHAPPHPTPHRSLLVPEQPYIQITTASNVTATP